MLVIGLGNPGQKYANTRHNVGRDILLEIIKSGDFSELKIDRYANALISEGFIEPVDEASTGDLESKECIIIALPETFMNRSGEAVKELTKKYSLTPERVVVIYDDIDLPFGRIKISKDRGDGGHNGVKSVAEQLGTRDFTRIRVGICPVNREGEKEKPSKERVSGYVLGHFSPKECESLPSLAKYVHQAMTLIAQVGTDRAMNVVNVPAL